MKNDVIFLVDDEVLAIFYIVKIIKKGGLSVVKILDILYETEHDESEEEGSTINVDDRFLFDSHSVFYEIFESIWSIQ